MSILIKGMEMPKDCDSCLFDDGVHCMAYPQSEDLVYDISDGKPNWCPLVPVPPHGRLIDADAFSEEMRKRHKAASDWYDSVEDNEMLARAESTMMAFTECRLTLDLETVFSESVVYYIGINVFIGSVKASPTPT